MLSPLSHTCDSRPCQQCGQPGTEHQGAAASCPAPTPTMIGVVGTADTRTAAQHYPLSYVLAYFQLRRGNAILQAGIEHLHALEARAEAAEAKLALIRATATRGVPCLINLYAIDRILGEEVRRA